MKTLRYGAVGADVRKLQTLLKKHGYFDGSIGGNFLTLTKAAVVHFQQTHQGPKGTFLAVDGVVGPSTWWALENASGPAQKSGLATNRGIIPEGISSGRRKILERCVELHGQNIREIPDGANSGDGVDQFVHGVGKPPWCCFCVSEIWKTVFGSYPLNYRHGHCLTLWRAAKAKGLTHYKGDYEPIPGDIFIMLYGTSGSGHTGFVSNVESGGRKFNTFEGNVGNRFKHGLREKAQSTLIGFINLYGDSDHTFTHQLISTAALDSALAATR